MPRRSCRRSSRTACARSSRTEHRPPTLEESAMKLASRLKKVKPSSTLAVTAKVLELKRQGREVVGFAAGEPDFDTWPHVCAAAHAAIERGDFHYTAVGGTPELKDAVIT